MLPRRPQPCAFVHLDFRPAPSPSTPVRPLAPPASLPCPAGQEALTASGARSHYRLSSNLPRPDMNPTTPTDATAAAAPESRGASSAVHRRDCGKPQWRPGSHRFPRNPTAFSHRPRQGHLHRPAWPGPSMAAATCAGRHQSAKEDESYVRHQGGCALAGVDWSTLLYAADMFEQMHDLAVALIKSGRAYVCDSPRK